MISRRMEKPKHIYMQAFQNREYPNVIILNNMAQNAMNVINTLFDLLSGLAYISIKKLKNSTDYSLLIWNIFTCK